MFSDFFGTNFRFFGVRIMHPLKHNIIIVSPGYGICPSSMDQHSLFHAVYESSCPAEKRDLLRHMSVVRTNIET